MNQQPDKLFRDKLQSFQTPAPSGAWNRIEANLDKKNHKVLWFRIAASLLLVAIATYLLWPVNNVQRPQSQLAKTTERQEIIRPEQNIKQELASPTPEVENQIAKTTANPPKRTAAVKKALKNESADKQIDLSENSLASAESNNKVEQPSEVITEQRQTAQIETQITSVASAETQKVKIIFSADEIDNKYLNKKSLAEATSDDKKPSTLKKLLDKAYDLKYNQDPFGDLRQRKDEILALNFRKDKRSDN
jgi:hypothetical protein